MHTTLHTAVNYLLHAAHVCPVMLAVCTVTALLACLCAAGLVYSYVPVTVSKARVHAMYCATPVRLCTATVVGHKRNA